MENILGKERNLDELKNTFLILNYRLDILSVLNCNVCD